MNYYSRMDLADEILIVLDTLNTQRVRALLTLLGIILGVGTLVALSSAIGSAVGVGCRVGERQRASVVEKAFWGVGTAGVERQTRR